MNVLIESPADFNALATSDIDTPMLFAFKHSALIMKYHGNDAYREIIKILIDNIIKKDIDLNATNVEGLNHFTAIEKCKDVYGFESLVEFALKNPNFKYILKQFNFPRACKWLSQNNENVIKYLIEKSKLLELDLNAQDEKGRTGFHNALLPDKHAHKDIIEFKHNIKVVKLFFDSHEKYGINLDKADNEGLTPFLMACKRYCPNQDEIIELFLKHKTKFNPKAKGDGDNMGPLTAFEHYISNVQSTSKMAKILYDLDKNSLNHDEIDFMTYVDEHYLYNRASCHDYESDTDASDDTEGERNVLHYLCEKSDVLYHQQGNLLKKILEILEYRLKDGIYFSLHAKDESGNTPLQLAIKSGNRDAVIALLKHHIKEKEKYSFSTRNEHKNEFIDTRLDWKDGFQAMALVLTCTPENCCSESEDRFEAICEIINANKLDIQVCKELITVKCSKLKSVVEEWLSNGNDTKSMGTADSKEEGFESDCVTSAKKIRLE